MKKLLLLSAIICSLFLFSCGNASEKKTDDGAIPADTSNGVSVMNEGKSSSDVGYICPCGGCPEIRETAPGKCSKCEMDLVEEK